MTVTTICPVAKTLIWKSPGCVNFPVLLSFSRAEITSQGFINVHNYGDLKAHPRDYLRRFLTEHGRRKALVNRLEKVGLYRAGL
jgi:hypothetical protein